MAKLHESIILKPPQFHTMCIFFDGTKQKTKGAMKHLKFESFVEVMLNNPTTEIFLTYVQVHWSENLKVRESCVDNQRRK